MNSIEIFAGCGGLGLGTWKAGFRHLLVLDNNRHACATLRHNKDRGVQPAYEWPIVECDVAERKFTPLRGVVDCVFGGPPCQPFSIGGKHRGHSDQRNLFPELARIISEVRPMAFMFENVKGLLRPKFQNYFSYILLSMTYPTVRAKGDEDWLSHLQRLERIHTASRFKGLHYNVVYRVLNAADFGVPQKRERVFIVGTRSDLGCEFAFPDATHSEDGLLYDQWISGEYWSRHLVPKSKRPRVPERYASRVRRLEGILPEMLLRPWRTVRDAICDLPDLNSGRTSPVIDNHYFNPGARSYAGHTGSPLDLPAKTLKAGDHGVPGGENTLLRADGSVRYFSIRECARLQTFPDDWLFEGSWTECMRQLGNAVPVLLAEAVATELRLTLLQTQKRYALPS